MNCCRRFNAQRFQTAWWTALFALIISFAQAQTSDSIYHRFDPRWTKYYFLDDPDKLEVIDTSTTLFHRYNQGYDEFNEATLGNLGYPSFRLTPQFVQHTGYRVGLDAYDAYLYSPENTPFYTTRRPYSSLDYLLGIKNEQLFSGTHTQNITRDYNFNVRFMRLGSEGNFARQRADYFNLSVGQSFITRNERYVIRALVYQNKLKIEQNGGVTVPLDTAYDEKKYFEKTLVPIRFDSSLTTLRERTVWVQQGIQFGKSYRLKTDSAKQKHVATTVRLLHTFRFSRVRYKYHTDSTDYDGFDNVFIDALKTNDSIQYDLWKNELRLELTDVQRRNDSLISYKPLKGNISFAHEFYQFVDTLKPRNPTNVIAAFDLETNFGSAAVTTNSLLRFVGLSVNGEYDLQGQNRGDYNFTGHGYVTTSWFTPSVFFRSNRFAPTRLQSVYSGNHFRWDNNFEQSEMTIVGASLYVKPLKGFLSYSAVAIQNPVYFDDFKKPAQLIGRVNGYSISAAPSFAYNNFHLDARFVWQYYDSDILSFPDFYSLASFYYNARLFKNALVFTVGTEARSNTTFAGPGFEPNTSQFYVQHLSESGDYVWLDAFLNIKIRSVRLCVIGQNLLQGTLKPGFFYATQYPMPDRSFKLRINWLFWN